MAFRSTLFRSARRALHPTRSTRASGGPAWGTEVNEPGGQLFGEAPLKAGERRKIQSWEVIFYSTMLASTLILGIGLNNKPESKTIKHIEAEAQRRVALMNLDDENDK